MAFGKVLDSFLLVIGTLCAAPVAAISEGEIIE